MNGNLATIDCTVVASLYEKNGPSQTDIAILHSGSYNAPSYLPLSTDVPAMHALVNIVGYPGELKLEWIRTQVGIRNADESLKATAKLLPIRTLTVSSGTVQSNGVMMAYNVSTCPGMSGSCVLSSGKVVGNDGNLEILI